MISYEDLAAAVAGARAGVRYRARLEPLGGPFDKIFPPTYAVDERAHSRYAEEERRIKGKSVRCVVLDSVSSQANRQEDALLNAVRRRDLALPLVSVDFSRIEGLAGLDRISSLQAPHRIYDALLRDSLLDEKLFRLSPVGRRIMESTSRDAAGLYRHSPTTLLFGGWDSTGPGGGMGARFERAVASEVVAIGVARGVKTASRIDPAGIMKQAATLYVAADKSKGTWTTLPEKAEKDAEGDPVRVGSQKKNNRDLGRPSQVNHGNVTPSIDARAGGITADRVRATGVLSFGALRKLRFPTDTEGVLIEAGRRADAEAAARTALAALGLAAVALSLEVGFDLRSRCVLVPVEEPSFSLVGRAGETTDFSLGAADALALVAEATGRAADLGLVWEAEEILLTPVEQLVELIRRSRDLAATSPTSDDAEDE